MIRAHSVQKYLFGRVFLSGGRTNRIELVDFGLKLDVTYRCCELHSLGFRYVSFRKVLRPSCSGRRNRRNSLPKREMPPRQCQKDPD